MKPPADRELATFVVRTPTDLVAAVPALIGFHPQDSVVLLTFGPSAGSFHARVDLPVAAAEQAEVAAVLVRAARSNAVGRAAVLLYTDDVEAAHEQALLLVGGLLGAEVEVIEVLRVDEGRWHPVPEDGSVGTSYELETHPFTAQRVYQGHVVHQDRAELADTLVGTDDEDAVAVALAATRFAELMATSGESRSSAHDFLAAEARWLRGRIRSRLADGSTLDPADAGRVLVLASLASGPGRGVGRDRS